MEKSKSKKRDTEEEAKPTKAKRGGESKSDTASRRSEAEKEALLQKRIAQAKVHIKTVPDAATVDALVAAVPDDIDGPPMPVKELLSEARQAIHNAEADLAALCKRNYPFTNLGIMNVLVERAQTLHNKARSEEAKGRSEAETAALDATVAWRTETLDNMALAANGDEEILAWISSVREGEGVDDAIDDAERIITKAQEDRMRELLEAVDVVADEVVEEAREHLQSLQPEVHRRRGTVGSEVRERDRVATALHKVLGRLYEFGKNVFRSDPQRARLYASSYTRTRKAVYRAKLTREKNKQGAEEKTPPTE